MNSDFVKKVLNKIKGDKKILALILIGLSGMLLILFSENGDNETAAYENNECVIYGESELSAELEKLIESIDGAGKSKVMITYDCYDETVYARNSRESFSDNLKRDVEYEYILIENAQTQQGLKLKINSPVVKGVAVVCQGGDNPITKEQIISVISALFDISSNKISVAVMA